MAACRPFFYRSHPRKGTGVTRRFFIFGAGYSGQAFARAAGFSHVDATAGDEVPPPLTPPRKGEETSSLCIEPHPTHAPHPEPVEGRGAHRLDR